MRPLLVLIALLAACSDPNAPVGPPAPLTQLPRALTAAEQDALAGSTTFGLGLFRSLSQARPGENVMVSPLSASFALGMALNGAAGVTRDSMRAVLGWGTRSEEEINEAYRGLATLLPSLDPQVALTSANSIWIDQHLPVLAPFVSTNQRYFGARVQNLDFASASAPPTINAWVRDATQQRITSIIDRIDPGEVMFLINALWFKGSWREKFDPARTVSSWFRNAGGDSVRTRMMSRTGEVRLFGGANFHGGELAYGNGAYGMLFLLPDPGTTVDQLAASMSPASWAAATALTNSGRGDVLIPRFELADDGVLNTALAQLGMGIAFSDRADFSGIAPLPLAITKVRQKSWIRVDEQGTEAAAVTSVGVGVTSAPPTSLAVDRAFVFAIRERLSGAILFIGKVAALPPS